MNHGQSPQELLCPDRQALFQILGQDMRLHRRQLICRPMQLVHIIRFHIDRVQAATVRVQKLSSPRQSPAHNLDCLLRRGTDQIQGQLRHRLLKSKALLYLEIEVFAYQLVGDHLADQAQPPDVSA